MEVIKAGHEYNLDNVDNGTQRIVFVEGPKDARIADGTTNEEVINVLIDRLTYLAGQVASEFTDNAIKGLQVALAHLEARTLDRIERGVEGTNAA